MNEQSIEREKILEGLKGWMERLEKADKEIRELHSHFRKVYLEIQNEKE